MPHLQNLAGAYLHVLNNVDVHNVLLKDTLPLLVYSVQALIFIKILFLGISYVKNNGILACLFGKALLQRKGMS